MVRSSCGREWLFSPSLTKVVFSELSRSATTQSPPKKVRLFCFVLQCFPQEVGGGDEHLDSVYAWAHTHCYIAYTTILCCVNTVKRGCCAPLWGKHWCCIHSYSMLYATFVPFSLSFYHLKKVSYNSAFFS